MRKILCLSVVVIFCSGLYAQKESFDLITYLPPKGWDKELKSNMVSYIAIDKSKGSWSKLAIYKSIDSKGSIEKDFDSDWQELIVSTYKVTNKPKLSEIIETKGWKIKGGSVRFIYNNKDAFAMLTTITGYGKAISIIATANNEKYVSDATALFNSIELAEPVSNLAISTPTINNSNAGVVKNKNAGKYAFTTTNFDDGWVAVQKEDWVEVTKSNAKFFIHYPNKVTSQYITDREQDANTAWNNLVAPRYSNLKNYSISSHMLDPGEGICVSADLKENATGKNVFVALFKRAKSGWIEFVYPDKAAFVKSFAVDPATFTYNTFYGVWEPLEKMASYNKFAVAASDLTGKWTDNFASNTYYANIYTGLGAGMSTYSSTQTFEFAANQTYKWKIATANSYAGKTDVNTGKAAGTFKMLNSWQIYFSDIEKKPCTYNAYFSCVKGVRLLWLQNAVYGTYSAYGKVEN